MRHVVLVDGAWTDGSGWRGVYDRLTRAGYRVDIVQEPLTSFEEDLAATRRALDRVDRRCLLVAQSYGGAVITEACTHPAVAGLVYVAAHMPDAGESEAETGKRFPSDLSRSTAVRKSPDGYSILDPAQCHAYFAADLPEAEAAFLARARVPIKSTNFPGEDHTTRLARAAELDAGGGQRSDDQSRAGTVVRRSGRESGHGGAGREPCRLHIASRRGRRVDPERREALRVIEVQKNPSRAARRAHGRAARAVVREAL